MRRIFSRRFATHHRGPEHSKRNRSIASYVLAASVFGFGMVYAAVPLYRAFCRYTGYGGYVKQSTLERLRQDAEENKKIPQRMLRVVFDTSTAMGMPWTFEPLQPSMNVLTGESALAFFVAENKLDKPVIGVATYSVNPQTAAKYFNKIQCFCFDEQRLKAKEKVDMPVLFVVDPKFCLDPEMKDVKELILSYIFFPTEHELGNHEDDEEYEYDDDTNNGQVCPEIPSSHSSPKPIANPLPPTSSAVDSTKNSSSSSPSQ
jgi:cytochrome c oxidase assembly protein subunit 11